jgi:hypothetical protein
MIECPGILVAAMQQLAMQGTVVLPHLPILSNFCTMQFLPIFMDGGPSEVAGNTALLCECWQNSVK